MQHFGISPELVEPMRPFLRALNWGTLPLLAYFALRRYLQAQNVVLPIMFALISANLVNLVGDWALIYGHLGLPAMGITGSGWATCVARIYMAGVLVVTLFWVESKRSAAEVAGHGSHRSAPGCSVAEAGSAGSDADPARNRGLLGGYSGGGQAGSRPSLRSRDRFELRCIKLHGAAWESVRPPRFAWDSNWEERIPRERAARDGPPSSSEPDS